MYTSLEMKERRKLMSKEEPPHIALAKARILSDLRYIDVWKADLIKDILLTESIEEYENKKLNKPNSESHAKREEA